MQYAMERALSLGLRDIAINTHHLAPVWQQFFPTTAGESYVGLNAIPCRSSSYLEASVSLFQEDELLETGGGIKNLENWIGGEDVLVYNGDIYCSIPLAPLVDLHNTGRYDATLIVRSEGPAKHLALEGDKVVDIRNTLGCGEGTHQFTGIYAISPRVLERLEANKKVSIIEAFLELAAEGKLGAVVVDEGEWFDLGTRDMYLEAHRSEGMRPANACAVQQGAKVSADAVVKECWISNGAEVGEGAVLTNCIIWEGVKVAAGAQLKNCVVLNDVTEPLVAENADL